MRKMDNPKRLTESAVKNHHWGHLAVEACLGLLIAVIHLVSLRGASIAVLLLFGFPMLYAITYLHRSSDKGARRIAFAFLLFIVVGGLIAPVPSIFPKMMQFDPALPPHADRMLSWYCIVYFMFILCVVPLYIFTTCLLKHQRGEPAKLSAPTCALGLAAVGLMGSSMPFLLGAMLGFWKLEP